MQTEWGGECSAFIFYSSDLKVIACHTSILCIIVALNVANSCEPCQQQYLPPLTHGATHRIFVSWIFLARKFILQNAFNLDIF